MKSFLNIAKNIIPLNEGFFDYAEQDRLMKEIDKDATKYLNDVDYEKIAEIIKANFVENGDNI